MRKDNMISNISNKISLAVDAIVFEAHDQMFRGSLFNRTVYSGPPNAEMDAAWARYIQAGSSK
jgi:hypothetical protein